MQITKFTRLAFIVIFFTWLSFVTVSVADDQVVNYSILLTKSLFLDINSKGDTVMAVGERGHIIISRNGNPWRSIKTGVNSTLTAVYLYDEEHAWAVGHDSVILKTTDGGNHWRRVYFAPEEETPLLDVWFENDQHGIAIGAYGLYLTTTDGGNTWHREHMNIVDAVSHGTPENEDEDLVDLYDLHLNAIAADHNGNLYIVAEAGRIYRSVDKGKSWHELKSPYIGSLFGILVLDDDSLLVFGLRGHLYHTYDHGNNWEEIDTHTREMLTDGEELDNGDIVIVGLGGTVLVSMDKGITFTGRNPGNRNSYSAVVSFRKNVIMAGDHGVEKYSYRQLDMDK